MVMNLHQQGSVRDFCFNLFIIDFMWISCFLKDAPLDQALCRHIFIYVFIFHIFKLLIFLREGLWVVYSKMLKYKQVYKN